MAAEYVARLVIPGITTFHSLTDETITETDMETVNTMARDQLVQALRQPEIRQLLKLSGDFPLPAVVLPETIQGLEDRD